MASFIAGLRNYLLSDATISGLLGTNRIYCGKAPKTATSPYVILQRVSGSARYGLSDLDGQDDNYWQIDVWSTSYSDCETLRIAIRTQLNGKYEITMGDYAVHSVTEEDSRETSEPDGDGSEKVWYRNSSDFTIIRDSNET